MVQNRGRSGSRYLVVPKEIVEQNGPSNPDRCPAQCPSFDLLATFCDRASLGLLNDVVNPWNLLPFGDGLHDAGGPWLLQNCPPSKQDPDSYDGYI